MNSDPTSEPKQPQRHPSRVNFPMHTPRKKLAIIGLICAFLSLFIFAAYNEIQSRSNESHELKIAKSVMKSIEAAYSDQGSYPMSIKDITTTYDTIIFSDVSVRPTEENTIEYSRCNQGQEARIGYWKDGDLEPSYLYTNPESRVVDCQIITE